MFRKGVNVLDEIKQILYAILEAEAVNAAEINELKRELKMIQEEMRRLADQQEQLLMHVEDADRVREARSFYSVS